MSGGCEGCRVRGGGWRGDSQKSGYNRTLEEEQTEMFADISMIQCTTA